VVGEADAVIVPALPGFLVFPALLDPVGPAGDRVCTCVVPPLCDERAGFRDDPGTPVEDPP
jgi:hypothetical protein